MDVRLPKLGEGAESGTVVSILVKEGDRVEKGQTLLELENEKAVAPIPSTAAGTVSRIAVKAGDKLSVGQVILTLSEAGPSAGSPAQPGKPAAAPAPAAKTKAETAEAAPPEAVAPEAEAVPASTGVMPPAPPSIRKLARDLGIDLTRVRGSAPGGRVGLNDVRAYIQRLQKLAAPAPGRPAAGPAAAEPIDFSKWGGISKKPLSSLRLTIGRRMTESWNAIPRVTQFDEADITALTELRKKHALAFEAKGARLTLTSFVLKAVVATLKKHPIFNSSLDEAAQEIVFKEYYHIGLAVDTEQGLIVPVLRDVDKKNLLQLSKEVNDLAEKARTRKVSLEELKGGTFTLSNQGGIGGAHFTPIVNKPEVAILGLGRGALKAVVRNQKIEPRLMLPLTVSYDHRLIDGGAAARFTVDLVQALENFGEQEITL
jgi:pyruvate dehydrogenase E2 component (dihydrolipoyllysine-residue acetyltransferase)